MDYQILEHSDELDGLGENAEDAAHFSLAEEVSVPFGKAVSDVDIYADAQYFVAVYADMEITGRDAVMRGTEHLNEVAVYVSNEDGEIGEHVYTSRAEYEDVDVSFEDAANSETEWDMEDVEMAAVTEPISLIEGIEDFANEY